MICDYCGKDHKRPTASWCPERTQAWQRGLGQRATAPLDVSALLNWLRGRR